MVQASTRPRQCPTKWVVTHLLVLSGNFAAYVSEVAGTRGDRRVSGQSGTCSLLGLVNGVGVLEQPICRKFDCWLI